MRPGCRPTQRLRRDDPAGHVSETSPPRSGHHGPGMPRVSTVGRHRRRTRSRCRRQCWAETSATICKGARTLRIVARARVTAQRLSQSSPDHRRLQQLRCTTDSRQSFDRDRRSSDSSRLAIVTVNRADAVSDLMRPSWSRWMQSRLWQSCCGSLRRWIVARWSTSALSGCVTCGVQGDRRDARLWPGWRCRRSSRCGRCGWRHPFAVVGAVVPDDCRGTPECLRGATGDRDCDRLMLAVAGLRRVVAIDPALAFGGP